MKNRANGESGGVWSSAVWQAGAILLLSVLIGLSSNFLRPKRLALTGDWSIKGQIASHDRTETTVVYVDEARGLFENNEALFLDARPHPMYRSGHIQGALSLPWEEFEKRFDEVMNGIPPDYPIVTYCDGESCGLSKELAFALNSRGYLNVRVLPDGWKVWQQADLPVESP